VSLDIDALERILPRYDGPGPRYTSYPTAPVWSDSYGAADFRASLARLEADRDVALYTHVPFCESLCHFCACNKIITRDAALPVRFLESVAREIATVREAITTAPHASQLHWGGGTPTHLDPAQLQQLYRLLTDAFPMRDGAEISIEVDPRVTTTDQIAALAECGFNRISMGVQDTNARTQQAINRIQPFAQTQALVEDARARGFESVNFDLIYGLPYQTEETFEQTLDEILTVQPDRIALYSYAHVTWVAKQQRGFERKDLPEASTKMRIMVNAIRQFLEAGYVHVGMDHFARKDDELTEALEAGTLRRNFMGYTTQDGVDVLAFGPSAISELSDAYAQSQRGLKEWQGAVEAGELATLRGHVLSADDHARSFIIARIMCHGALDAKEYEARFGGVFRDLYSSALASLEPLQQDALVEVAADGSLQVLPLGRLLVRNVAMAFDAYLPEQQRAAKPIFSKTV
jgi:oxygen-independent coproporphyrinogen-3 oxidase